MKTQIKEKQESVSAMKEYGNGLHVFYKTMFSVVLIMACILALLVFVVKM